MASVEDVRREADRAIDIAVRAGPAVSAAEEIAADALGQAVHALRGGVGDEPATVIGLLEEAREEATAALDGLKRGITSARDYLKSLG